MACWLSGNPKKPKNHGSTHGFLVGFDCDGARSRFEALRSRGQTPELVLFCGGDSGGDYGNEAAVRRALNESVKVASLPAVPATGPLTEWMEREEVGWGGVVSNKDKDFPKMLFSSRLGEVKVCSLWHVVGVRHMGETFKISKKEPGDPLIFPHTAGVL